MDLLAYFRVLRRRWLMILLLTVVGAAIGAASTEIRDEQAKAETFYKATSVLQLDTSTTSDATPAFTNIEQVAILVTTGEVPDLVAKELGTDENGRELSEKVVTLTNSVPSTLAITVVDRDPQRATELADSFAKNLVTSVDARLVDRYTKTRDDLTQQVAELQQESNGLLAQLSAVPPPPNVDTIRRQYDAVQNDYYSAFGSLKTLTREGAPQSGLTTLETAQSVPISETEYDSRLSLGVSGQNNLRAETSTNGTSPIIVSSSSGSDRLDDPLSRGILGAILGALAGIGLALVRDRLDHRIRTRNEAEDAFGLPVLADIPKFTRAQQRSQEVVAVSAPLSRTAEAYRAVRTSLLFQQSHIASNRAPGTMGNGNGNGTHRAAASAEFDPIFEPEQPERLVIMVTSASPREGKSNTSANLAAVFAEAGASVLVVNCDFRRPTIHRLLGVEDMPRTVQKCSIPGVHVVTNVVAEPNANPAQVVAAQRQVVAAARQRFDVIILDTAPILTANDAIEVVGSADLVLLVARSELTTTDKAERAMDILTRLEAPLGGVVLIGSGEVSNDYYYYYQRGRVESSRKRGDSGTTVVPQPAPADGP